MLNNSKKQAPTQTFQISEREADVTSNFYTDKDQKIKNHEYEIEFPEIIVQQKSLTDIPEQLFKRKSHPLPYQGLIIDRDAKQKLFRHMLKYTHQVTENQRE